MSAPMQVSYSLAELLPGGGAAELAAITINGLTRDSRQVHPGDLYFAMPGARDDGAAFIDDAIANGAVAICRDGAESGVELRQQAGRSVPVVAVPQLREQLGGIADRFYGHPSQELTVVGVTGTNGKTSVTHFIARALAADGGCGLIGTLGSGLIGQPLATTGRTTPEAITLQRQLAEFRAAGAHGAVMEVSSHGIDQRRIDGVAFDAVVFTNLTHDHLDYHGDMAHYAATKRRLLGWRGVRGVVINLDDPTGLQWAAELASEQRVVGFSLIGTPAPAGIETLYGGELSFSPRGLAFNVDSPFGHGHIECGLMGRFNAANLLAALGVLLLVGVDFATACERLARTETVPGRMERFAAGAEQPVVVVDYAHTPDALQQVLSSLREHAVGECRITCVFGCGGERDQLKRPMMGRIAEQWADRVVITHDNPRSEEPEAIIAAIRSGMRAPQAAQVVADRAAAIASAIAAAGPNDIVLVAGKGHEDEQVIGQTRLTFSDRAEVARILGSPPHG